jgi:hypothetical protein
VPYEVRGGFAIQDRRLWDFVKSVMRLEHDCFGAQLSDYKSEIKGTKLLGGDRFKQLAKDPRPAFDAGQRQKLCRTFLQAGLEKRPPTRDQLTAYAQASLAMADGLFHLLFDHYAVVFASMIPRGTAKPPVGTDSDRLRKDHTFLLERFYYFLEGKKEMGLLVMDEVEKDADRRFVSRLHGYFTKTGKGNARTHWIVPSPFFVSSDMALPIQVADVVLYAINWGYRHPKEPHLTGPVRKEIADRYQWKLGELKWKGDGYHDGRVFRSYGIFCVHDLFAARE